MKSALLCLVTVACTFNSLHAFDPETGSGDALTWKFDGSPSQEGFPLPWKLKVGSGKSQIEVRRESAIPGQSLLWLRAEKSSFFLGRDDQQFSPVEFPVITWSWKAIILPKGGDVRKSSLLPFADNRNDQALQLLVTFESRDVISYLWDTTAPEGTDIKENNPFVNIMSVVVQSGPSRLKEWISYRRNIREDYRRLFKREPGKVIGIAVQTNSNHTRSVSEGVFGPVSVGKSNGG